MNKIIAFVVIVFIIFFSFVGLYTTKNLIAQTKKEQNKILQQKQDPKNIDKNETTVVVKKVEKKKIVSKLSNKKQHFVNTMVPIITTVYKELQTQYKTIKDDIAHNRNRTQIERLKQIYKAKNDQDLLEAIKPHPISIALAQCAIESAWLTSRFTKEANNLFGIWSFNSKEPRIAAKSTRGDRTIYLKKYYNYYASVQDYYKSVAKSWAFKELRDARVSTNDPYELIKYFDKYSELKGEYVNILRNVIRKNNFTQYDIKDTF